VAALASQSPLDPDTEPILIGALKDPHIEVQVEAARYLGDRGMNHLLGIFESRNASTNIRLLIDIVQIFKENDFRKSIPVLKKVYLSDRGDALKIAILQALAAFGDEGHSFLLAELDKDHPPGLCIAVIEALGTWGRVEAVEKLCRIEELTLYSSVRQAATQAIARIQSRLGNVEKGWLSMAKFKDVDGALSVAPQPGDGALSAVEEGAGEKHPEVEG
jgi:hypothetical protein